MDIRNNFIFERVNRKGIGTGCPGRWGSHCPWRCSRNADVWRDVVSGHGGSGLTVGLDDLRGLFQPE